MLCRIIASYTGQDRLSVWTPKFSCLDIGEPTTFANQSVDTGFSSFKSSNFGWLKGKQTQTWWQSHTHNKTHTYTQKKRVNQANEQSVNQSMNQSNTQQTKNNKKRDRQTNKRTNRQTNRTACRDTHSISWATSNRSTSTLRNRLRGMSHTNLHLAIASLVYASWVKKWLGSGRWYMNCCFNDLCSGLLRNLPFILELDEIFWFEILK